MKIDNYTSSTELHSGQVEKAQQIENQRPGRAGRSGAAVDSAAISPLAQQIAERLQVDSPESVARVAEARKLYQTNGFAVPSPELADALIQGAVSDTALLAELSGDGRGA